MEKNIYSFIIGNLYLAVYIPQVAGGAGCGKSYQEPPTSALEFSDENDSPVGGRPE